MNQGVGQLEVRRWGCGKGGSSKWEGGSELGDPSFRKRCWLLLLWKQNTAFSDRVLDLWHEHIQFDLIFDALLDRWQDSIQIHQFACKPNIEGLEEVDWILGGMADLSLLKYLSYFSINKQGRPFQLPEYQMVWRGIFNQGLAAPPAKLPAILSVLMGHEGEFSLQNNTGCSLNSTTTEISKSSPPFLPKLWIKQMKKISFCVSWTALDWQLHVSQLQWRTKGSLHHQHKQHKGKND